jgi:hypothetical protein
MNALSRSMLRLALAAAPLSVACNGQLRGKGQSTVNPDGGTGMTFGADGATCGVAGPLIHVTRVRKLDVLLVVDDAPGMADKLARFGGRLDALLTPLLRTGPDASGAPPKIDDVHVGVISASLGSFGTSACAGASHPHGNDDAHLLPRDAAVGKALPGTTLTWSASTSSAPGATYVGDAGAKSLIADVSAIVSGLAADGCSYSAPLEATYRFLIDPAPYQTAAAKCAPSSSGAGDSCSGTIAMSGVDSTLLTERAQFLRPDSALAVVVLSDRDDQSLNPSGQNWIPLALAPQTMPRGWGSCATVPDDVDDDGVIESMFDCWSCIQPGKGDDPACKTPWPTTTLDVDADGPHLRLTRQVQRYGYDFLWPVDRYVKGFTNTIVVGSDGKMAPNGIYNGGFRTSDLVTFATIAGAPNDLVANPDGTARSLDLAGWSKLVDPSASTRDPRMVESIGPRAGLSRYKGAGDLSADPVSGTGSFRNGNGGDRDVPDGDDLQYACMQARPTGVALPNDRCSDPKLAAVDPACVASGTGYSQAYSVAFPGLRQLRVAEKLGASAIVGSICSSTPEQFLGSVAAHIESSLNGLCPTGVTLTPSASGTVNCALEVVFDGPTGPHGETSCEAINPSGKLGYCTPGSAPCRVAGSALPPLSTSDFAASACLKVLSTDATGVTTIELAAPTTSGGNVYADGHLVCELYQYGTSPTTSADATACQNDPTFTATDGNGGWCWSRNLTVLGPSCVDMGSMGTLRFGGAVQPPSDALLQPICPGGM